MACCLGIDDNEYIEVIKGRQSRQKATLSRVILWSTTFLCLVLIVSAAADSINGGTHPMVIHIRPGARI